MTLRNIGIVAILMLGMVSEAPAQVCSPYDPNCTTTISEPFPNVLYNVAGLPHAVVSVKNLTGEPMTATIEITIGSPGDANFRIWGRSYEIGAGGKKDVFITDPIEWEMIAEHSGGVAVTVKAIKQFDATVTMHPPLGPTFWSGAKILEGR